MKESILKLLDDYSITLTDSDGKPFKGVEDTDFAALTENILQLLNGQ